MSGQSMRGEARRKVKVQFEKHINVYRLSIYLNKLCLDI